MTNFLRKARNRAVLFLLAALIALPLQSLLYLKALADTPPTWMDGAMPQLTLGKELSTSEAFPPGCYNTTFLYHSYTKPSPTSPGGFVNDPVGRQIPVDVCAQTVGFGEFSTSGRTYLRPNTALAFNAPNGIHPNPYNNGFYYRQETVTASKFAMFNSLAEAGTFTKIQVVVNSYGHDELGYGLYTIPGSAYMKDRNGNDAQAPRAEAYSSDGTWMAAYIVNIGFVRINTITHQMLVFDDRVLSFTPGFTPPGIALTISDDGNTVLLSGGGQNPMSTEVFDLSGCTGQPRTVGGTTLTSGCRSRMLHSTFASQYPGFVGILKTRFTSDGKGIRGVVQIDVGNAHHYYSATLALAGYTMPHVSYLALGDSFSSGEGAHNYKPPTDMSAGESDQFPKGNKCHLSTNSYPYLVAQSLGLEMGNSFHDVACSGAETVHYFRDSQYDNLPNRPVVWLSGEHPQSVYATEIQPDAITISMIGNDIGFGDIVSDCVWLGTCYPSKESREELATRIYSKFSTLERLYKQILVDSGGARVYVMGYPQIVNHGYCSANVHLNDNEIGMARGLTTFLNSVIKAAAQKIGVQYIDVEDVFADHQLCEDGAKAVNGLTAGDDMGIFGMGIGMESYHPNAYGHYLMAQELLRQSDRLTRAMPGAISTSTAPDIHSSQYLGLIGEAPSIAPVPPKHPLTNVDSVSLRGESIAPKSGSTLKPNSTYSAELHSDPISLGTLTTNQFGELEGEVVIPDSVGIGRHELHLYGKSITGEDIDLYKAIYVAASMEDYDGDGVLNDDEECLVIEPAGADEDRDGIDDACDAEISEPPADIEPPVVSGAPDRDANGNGWYNDNVTINWTVADPDPSSGTPTQPAATVADQEGVHTYTSDQSCDPLSNCATGSLELKIDKTAPIITYSLSPGPNENDWHNSSVTVTFNCADAISGVVSCSDPQVVSGADGIYVVTGEVADLAGNTNSVNALVSLDGTTPTVTQSIFPAANTFGWNNTDVTVMSLCDDNLSGVLDCSPSATLSAEGANQVIESTARDNAGNVATASTSVNIDKTAPTLGGAVWANNPKSILGTATISIPAADNLSGIAEAEYYLGDIDPGQGNGATMRVNDGSVSVDFNTDFPTGVYKVTMRAKDKAGNWSQPLTDYLVVYDPFGTRMTGKRMLAPSPASGDILPGLISANQDDKAKFGFNVRYDKDGNIHKNSDFQFKYETGTKCSKPAQAQNCHTFELNTTSIAWLTTQGENNSTGIFQGAAALEVDGIISNVIFRLTGLDGEQLNATSEDRLTLKIYPENANPNTADPIYQVDAGVLRGNIKIRTW